MIRVKDVIFYFQFVLGLVSFVYHFDDVASVFFGPTFFPLEVFDVDPFGKDLTTRMCAQP